MNRMKVSLLAATTFAGLAASFPVQAQIALPAAELRGIGASSIQNIVVQSLNCVGRPGDGLNKLGVSSGSGSLSTIATGAYVPTAPTTTNPSFICATQEIQPDFEGKYVATGSGLGRQMWRLFSNQFTGAAGSVNPFAASTGTWNKVQFAFSDTPASASDLSAYASNANSATNKAGAAIQFPLYVLPVALAYNPRYGVKNDGVNPAVDLNFNLKASFIQKDAAGNPIGGLRLTRAAYCKIFNGEITNFNDPALKVSNGALSLMSAADDANRWANEGVPIRLVGRVDKSGTTDIFSRHLAASCTGLVTTNKFTKAAESLPFDSTGAIDMSGFRSDTNYKPGVAAANFAGTVQSISGAFFNRASGGSIVTSQGAEALGLFMLADGSSGVRDAINFAPDRQSALVASIKLNGKFGYIGADFVAPAPGATLFSANLQKGETTLFVMPNARNAQLAMGTILPPQTTQASGLYDETDGRTNSATGLAVNRANPLDWTDVLYKDPALTLAKPGNGYPITGTTQLLTYTCYATPATRLAMIEFLGLTLGKVNKTSTATPLSPNTFKGVGKASLGIIPQIGIAPLPAAWANAVNETFLKKSVQSSNGTVLGNRNLWIQDKYPLKATDINGISTVKDKELLSNPGCTPGAGA